MNIDLLVTDRRIRLQQFCNGIHHNFTFTFKNKLTEKFIQVTSVATGGGRVENVLFVEENATAFEIVKDGDNDYKGDYSLKATVDGTDGYLCNTTTNVNYATHYNGNGHQGGWATIVEAPDFGALFAEVNAVLNMFGDGLGQYSGVSEEDLAAAKVEMETPNDLNLKVLKDYKALSTEAELNLPKVGQFFRIKNNGGSGYLSSGTGTGRTQFIANIGESASSIFYYDNGKLLAYENGLYLAKTDNFLHYTETLGAAAGVEFSFAESPARGKYLISFGGRSFYSGGTGESNAASSGQTGDNYRFTLEEVTELPFNISSVGYGTLWAPVALEIPVHVKAYTGVLSDDKTELVLTKITTGIIPAGTGVVIYRDDDEYVGNDEAGTTHNFAITSTTETLESKFSGSVAKINAGANAYTLQLDNSGSIGVAFKPSAATIPGFKAYLQVPDPVESETPAQALRIRFAGENHGGTTSLESSELKAQGSALIYDLQGRRVLNPTKGMYIVNGKKMVIK